MYEILSKLFSVHIEDISPMNIYEVRFVNLIILTISVGQYVGLWCLFSLNDDHTIKELKIMRKFKVEHL
jgi:hypothetical protein